MHDPPDLTFMSGTTSIMVLQNICPTEIPDIWFSSGSYALAYELSHSLKRRALALLHPIPRNASAGYVNFSHLYVLCSAGPPIRRWCSRAIWPPYRGKPPYPFQIMSANSPAAPKAILTALYRDTALYWQTALLGDLYRVAHCTAKYT